MLFILKLYVTEKQCVHVTYIIKSLQADNVRWLQSTDISLINSCVHHHGSEGSDLRTLMMKTKEALKHGGSELLDTADMTEFPHHESFKIGVT